MQNEKKIINFEKEGEKNFIKKIERMIVNKLTTRGFELRQAYKNKLNNEFTRYSEKEFPNYKVAARDRNGNGMIEKFISEEDKVKLAILNELTENDELVINNKKDFLLQYGILIERNVDLEELAAAENLIIEEKPMDRSYNGYIIFNNRCGIIFINKEINDTRVKRFTIAHEIAHFILHRNDRSEMQVFEVLEGQQFEREADRFAADILMPKEIIEQKLNKELNLELIKEIADKFNVTYSAMAFRVADVMRNYLSMIVIVRQSNNEIKKFYNRYSKYFDNNKVVISEDSLTAKLYDGSIDNIKNRFLNTCSTKWIRFRHKPFSMIEEVYYDELMDYSLSIVYEKK